MIVEGALIDSGIELQCVMGEHVSVGGHGLQGGGLPARSIRASQGTFSSLIINIRKFNNKHEIKLTPIFSV